MEWIRLSQVMTKHFLGVHRDCKQHKHTHYWLKGGRGSTKSSFVSLELPILLLQHPDCHVVVMRKVGNTLRNSVFPQIEWALDALKIKSKFKITKSPPEITYKKTGQKILFLGVDDKSKIKSLKLPFGYVGIVWFEELDQFAGMNEIRNLNQSLLRGGSDYWCFYSYNPPKSRDNWVNVELLQDTPDRLVDHSSYLEVPEEWLGVQFFLEAEKLQLLRPDLYDHEYLGEVTGTGGDIFDNVVDLKMSDELIASFDVLYHGMDFGFANDPFAYVKSYYDSKHDALYIFDEVYGLKLSNEKAYRLTKDKIGMGHVYADSADPKSISQLRGLGLKCLPCKKGSDSRDFGIKWLSDRAKIYIDKRRCPNTYREFTRYEFAQDKYGNFISEYPDKNDHTIDAVRYSLDSIISARAVVAKHVNY